MCTFRKQIKFSKVLSCLSLLFLPIRAQAFVYSSYQPFYFAVPTMVSDCSFYVLDKSSLTKLLHLLLRNFVAGSVLNACGIPCLAIEFLRKSITLSVVGFLKNIASD